jgi:ribosome maturation protein Sdo1
MNLGNIEILRDFYNTNHRQISKLEQVMEQGIIQLTDEQKNLILQHKLVERILIQEQNSDE